MKQKNALYNWINTEIYQIIKELYDHKYNKRTSERVT